MQSSSVVIRSNITLATVIKDRFAIKNGSCGPGLDLLKKAREICEAKLEKKPMIQILVRRLGMVTGMS